MRGPGLINPFHTNYSKKFTKMSTVAEDNGNWFLVRAERVLEVHRGIDVILCDRDTPRELLMKFSDEQLMELKEKFFGEKR